MPYRGKVLVTQEVEGLAPDGESLGGQLGAMQRALDVGVSLQVNWLFP